MNDGIYRIFKLRYDSNGQAHRKLVCRILVSGGQLWHLEDHHSMEDILPEGPVSDITSRRFEQLKHSGYHQVVDENDIQEGLHPDHLEAVDTGSIESETKFMMTGKGIENPALVELWDHAIMVDGKRLSDAEANQLLAEVHAGRVFLSPVD